MSTSALSSRARAKQSLGVTPRSRACWLAFIMVGPSARGSEKGIWISMQLTPHEAIVLTSCRVVSRSGNPATTWVMIRTCALFSKRAERGLHILYLRAEKFDPVVPVQGPGRDEDVFVAPSGDVHDHDLVPGQARGQPAGQGY